jgi:hypothetical protein
MTRLQRAVERLVGPAPVHESVVDAMIVVTAGGYVAGVLAAHYGATVEPSSPVEFLPVLLVPILIVPFGVLAFRRVAHPRVMLDDWLEERTDWLDDEAP